MVKKARGLAKRWYMLRDLLGFRDPKCNYKTHYRYSHINSAREHQEELATELISAFRHLESLALRYPPQDIDELFDRVFIKNFLNKNSEDIKKAESILEFCGNRLYAKDFTEAERISYITYFDYSDETSPFLIDFRGDLRDISTLPTTKFDCIIATQVIFYDILKVQDYIAGLKYMLNPGGVLLLTAPYFPPPPRRGSSGQELFFTEKGLRNLLLTQFEEKQMTIEPFGHALSYLCPQFMIKTPELFANPIENDPDYPMIFGARCINS